MEPQVAIRSFLARQPVSDLIPYVAYDEKRGLYCLDTGIGFVFECQPLAFIGPDTALILKGVFESNQLPSGSAIQFTIYASPNVKHLLDGYVFLRENALGAFLAGMGVGIIRQSMMAVVTGIGAGLAVAYMPEIINGIVTAQF